MRRKVAFVARFLLLSAYAVAQRGTQLNNDQHLSKSRVWINVQHTQPDQSIGKVASINNDNNEPAGFNNLSHVSYEHTEVMQLSDITSRGQEQFLNSRTEQKEINTNINIKEPIKSATKEHNAGVETVMLYPNPTSASVFLNGLDRSSKIQIQLFNLNGELITSEYSQNGGVQFDVRNLPTGNYFLRYPSSNGEGFKTQRFIVKR